MQSAEPGYQGRTERLRRLRTVSEVLGVMGAIRAHGGPEIGANPAAKSDYGWIAEPIKRVVASDRKRIYNNRLLCI